MGVIARYREHLPVGPATPEVDLNEGSTPLVQSHNIARALGLKRLYFKYEGLNPTGSFKDRGMVVAVAKALEGGSRVFMCASTGNTSASMAAYAARTGARAIVVVPSGEIALNKLSQALMYGAKVIALQGNFDFALETVRDLTSRYPVALRGAPPEGNLRFRARDGEGLAQPISCGAHEFGQPQPDRWPEDSRIRN